MALSLSPPPLSLAGSTTRSHRLNYRYQQNRKKYLQFTAGRDSFFIVRMDITSDERVHTESPETLPEKYCPSP